VIRRVSRLFKMPQKKADVQVGLHGCRASASINRWRKTIFPSVPAGFVRAVADQPWAATSAAYTLCSMFAHISPIAGNTNINDVCRQYLRGRHTVNFAIRQQTRVLQGIRFAR
jgi:hypothetical protein